MGRRGLPCDRCILLEWTWSSPSQGKGDVRTGDNVELIPFPDRAPFLGSCVWGCEPFTRCWEDTCRQEGCFKCLFLTRCSLKVAKEFLHKSPDYSAFCHVGGKHEGLRIRRGPLKGHRLAHGDVVFFKDGFQYWWGGCDSEQGVTTVTKEPKLMRA